MSLETAPTATRRMIVRWILFMYRQKSIRLIRNFFRFFISYDGRSAAAVNRNTGNYNSNLVCHQNGLWPEVAPSSSELNIAPSSIMNSTESSIHRLNFTLPSSGLNFAPFFSELNLLPSSSELNFARTQLLYNEGDVSRNLSNHSYSLRNHTD